MSKFFAGSALAALIALTLPHSALAASMEAFGSFGFTPLGDVTTSNGDVNFATSSVTFPAILNVNTIAETYLGHSTNLSLVPGEAVTIDPSKLNIGAPDAINPVAETVSVGTYTFRYTQEETTAFGPGTIALLFNGTFKDSSGVLMPGNSDLSLALTQTATGASVNGSFSVNTPLSRQPRSPCRWCSSQPAFSGLP